MAAALSLAPLPVLAQSMVIADVSYLGNGIYNFKSQAYGYDALVAAVQAAHPGEHIDVVRVDMGTVVNELDRIKVCQLRQSLQTRVKMYLTVDGKKHELFCT
jgi:hypothetical protein